jgi:hypothetical protein
MRCLLGIIGRDQRRGGLSRGQCLVGGKIIFKLVLELKSNEGHSQAGMMMNGIMPRPAMKPLMVAFLRVQVGLWASRKLHL